MKMKLVLNLAMALAALPALAENVIMMDQGSKWNDKARQKYYTLDQGSQLIPLAWFKALRQPNGEPFMADSLARYGYLPMPDRKTAKDKGVAGLPVGFTTNEKFVGMTCSACHTRQIDVAGKAYRIDGGPSFTDFQAFMADLDVSVNHILTNEVAFDLFANQVLGKTAGKSARNKLRTEVAAWFKPYHAIVKGSLPVDAPWGPARLDAVSMIFNRLTGLDIGVPPNYIIESNIKLADAPTRYPFLWNAPIQDRTQWPGFSENGNRILALSRNLGEVIGVFGTFHPVKAPLNPLKISYVKNNSANFVGLNRLESQVMRLGPPKWPWPLKEELVKAGKDVFYKKDAQNGNYSCNDCHGIRKGATRSLTHETWATPVLDVGTDSREVLLLTSQVKTGILEGTSVGGEPLKAMDYAFAVLKNVVAGSILQHYTAPLAGKANAKEKALQEQVQAKLKAQAQAVMQTKLKAGLDADDEVGASGSTEDLKQTYQTQVADTNAASAAASGPVTNGPFKYESRVLQGIWAAAPYLHNGSVPTLAELLKPSDQRVAEFRVGPAYDIETVGLALNQDKFNFTLKTTDCSKRDSGNSRCGHEYGTGFSADEKKALLEYLKQL